MSTQKSSSKISKEKRKGSKRTHGKHYKTQIFSDYGLGDMVTPEYPTTQKTEPQKSQEPQLTECESCYKNVQRKDLREIHYSLKKFTKSRMVCEQCYQIETSEYECCAYCGLNSYGCSPCSECKMD